MNNCKLINNINVEKGILLSILYYILDNYSKLKNKIIIINNKRYRKILKILFTRLSFSKYKNDKNDKKNDKNNFYFNIRNIIKEQDIVIDYLSNYNKYINTKKIRLIPWYDMNDPLIFYKYNSKYNLDVKKYKKYIYKFSKCKRGDYNNKSWDEIKEDNILNEYVNFNYNIDISELNYIIDYYLNKYTNLNNIIKPIYIPYCSHNNINKNDSIINLSNNTDNINDNKLKNDEQNILKNNAGYKTIDLLKILYSLISNIDVDKNDINYITFNASNLDENFINNININNDEKMNEELVNEINNVIKIFKNTDESNLSEIL